MATSTDPDIEPLLELTPGDRGESGRRPSRGTTAWLVLLLVVAVTVLSSVVLLEQAGRHEAAMPSVPPPPAPLPRGSDCPLNGKLVPACGVLWGFYSRNNDSPANTTVEATVGRRFAILKHYHDFSNTPNGLFPTVAERAEMRTGHILHLAWESTVFQQPGPGMPRPDAKTSAGRTVYSYGMVASGALDTYIDGVAASVAGVRQPIILDFGHEADAADTAYGSPSDYVAAYRHVVERFRAVGADNVVWAWVVTGSSTYFNVRYQALYPGDDVVDWIGWDPYNHNPRRWEDPQQVFRKFYDRLDAGLLGPAARMKPRMLGEYGVGPDPRQPAWLEQVPAALAALPEIKAVEYFNSGSWARLDTASTAALRSAGQNPYVSAGLPPAR